MDLTKLKICLYNDRIITGDILGNLENVKNLFSKIRMLDVNYPFFRKLL